MGAILTTGGHSILAVTSRLPRQKRGNGSLRSAIETPPFPKVVPTLAAIAIETGAALRRIGRDHRERLTPEAVATLREVTELLRRGSDPLDTLEEA